MPYPILVKIEKIWHLNVLIQTIQNNKQKVYLAPSLTGSSNLKVIMQNTSTMYFFKNDVQNRSTDHKETIHTHLDVFSGHQEADFHAKMPFGKTAKIFLKT